MGLCLMVVPGLTLMTFWSLIVPAIVIGESPAMASFGRSWRTVRGHGWFLVAFEIVLSSLLAVLPIPANSFTLNVMSGRSSRLSWPWSSRSCTAA